MILWWVAMGLPVPTLFETAADEMHPPEKVRETSWKPGFKGEIAACRNAAPGTIEAPGVFTGMMHGSGRKPSNEELPVA